MQSFSIAEVFCACWYNCCIQRVTMCSVDERDRLVAGRRHRCQRPSFKSFARQSSSRCMLTSPNPAAGRHLMGQEGRVAWWYFSRGNLVTMFDKLLYLPCGKFNLVYERVTMFAHPAFYSSTTRDVAVSSASSVIECRASVFRWVVVHRRSRTHRAQENLFNLVKARQL